MNPISVVSLTSKLASRLLAPLNTQAQFEKARDEQTRDWLAELAAQVQALETVKADLLERVSSAEERLFHQTVLRLWPEAIGALSADHRSLLAAAAAGVLRPDFDVETKSRVLRALSQLEPADIVQLRQLANTLRLFSSKSSGDLGGRYDPHQNAPVGTSFFRENVLRTALCAEETEYGMKISHLGTEVLRYLEAWEPHDSTTAAKAPEVGPSVQVADDKKS